MSFQIQVVEEESSLSFFDEAFPSLREQPSSDFEDIVLDRQTLERSLLEAKLSFLLKRIVPRPRLESYGFPFRSLGRVLQTLLLEVSLSLTQPRV